MAPALARRRTAGRCRAGQRDRHSPAKRSKALATLPAHERAVFALYYVGDLSLREVGRILGIPEGTVKTRLHAGLMRLRQQLRAGEGEVVA